MPALLLLRLGRNFTLHHTRLQAPAVLALAHRLAATPTNVRLTVLA
jgi:hypothetical protein